MCLWGNKTPTLAPDLHGCRLTLQPTLTLHPRLGQYRVCHGGAYRPGELLLKLCRCGRRGPLTAPAASSSVMRPAPTPLIKAAAAAPAYS